MMSLFICPGLGHRYLGRNHAYKTVLALFFGSFLLLAFSVYSMAQEFFSTTQEKSVSLHTLQQIVAGAAGKAAVSSASLAFMIIIYFAAPIELLITGLFFRKSG